MIAWLRRLLRRPRGTRIRGRIPLEAYRFDCRGQIGHAWRWVPRLHAFESAAHFRCTRCGETRGSIGICLDFRKASRVFRTFRDGPPPELRVRIDAAPAQHDLSALAGRFRRLQNTEGKPIFGDRANDEAAAAFNERSFADVGYCVFCGAGLLDGQPFDTLGQPLTAEAAARCEGKFHGVWHREHPVTDRFGCTGGNLL